MDIFDRATEIEDRDRALAVAAARERSRRESTRFNGFCLYCNNRISMGNFCDLDCRKDWEIEQHYQNKN